MGSSDVVRESEAFINQHIIEDEKYENIINEFIIFENLKIKVTQQEVECHTYSATNNDRYPNPEKNPDCQIVN